MKADRDELYLTHIAETIDLIKTLMPRTVEELARAIRTYETRRCTDFRRSPSPQAFLSDGARARHPEIPWAGIVGFRNRLAHGYVDVKLDRVWEVLRRDLGPLREAVQIELGRDRGPDRGHDSGLDIGF